VPSPPASLIANLVPAVAAKPFGEHLAVNSTGAVRLGLGSQCRPKDRALRH
jgi:hypothetical protein